MPTDSPASAPPAASPTALLGNNQPAHSLAHRREARIGLLYGMAAYFSWGFIPIYFKQVDHIAPLLILAHRVVWSFTFLGILIACGSRWDELRQAIRSRRTLFMLAISTVLLAINWGVFIYSVASHRVLQSSLGYFIVPIVSAALGAGVLKERLRGWQWSAVCLASLGVVILSVARGSLPWIALVLTFSWSGYSLIRKIAQVGPLVGVAVETAILFPVAAAYIFFDTFRESAADAIVTRPTHDLALLMLAGVVTALPLIWFTAGARRLRLSTVGFLQYITPTCQFLLAVFAYNEPFTRANAAGFALIWLALIVYSVDSLRAYNARPALTAEI